MPSWNEITKAAEAAKKVMISDPRKGKQVFDIMLQKFGEDGMIYFKRGEAYEQLAQLNEAVKDYERAKELFPKPEWQKAAEAALDRVKPRVQAMVIFISHSSKDADLALLLIELLRTALGLRDHEIRCTSVDGFRLPAGANTEQQLKVEVHSARAFIGLITLNSLKSAYVLFELGARWGANRHMVPVLAGVSTDALQGPLKGINAISANNIAQVYQLITDLARLLEIQPQSPAAYTRYAEKLVQQAQHLTANPLTTNQESLPTSTNSALTIPNRPVLLISDVRVQSADYSSSKERELFSEGSVILNLSFVLTNTGGSRATNICIQFRANIPILSCGSSELIAKRRHGLADNTMMLELNDSLHPGIPLSITAAIEVHATISGPVPGFSSAKLTIGHHQIEDITIYIKMHADGASANEQSYNLAEIDPQYCLSGLLRREVSPPQPPDPPPLRRPARFRR